MGELELMYEHLNGACCPEDVFGSDPTVSFKKLARACHPDIHSEPIAKKTFQKLNQLREEADTRIKRGVWGKRLPMPHCIPLEIGKYNVDRIPIVGDVADLYRVEGKDLYVKVVRSSDDNDLLRAEASALKILADINPPVVAGVPSLKGEFQIEGAKKRKANVISSFTGFLTAQEIFTRIGDHTVDKRTGVWMFKRILSLLSWVHHFDLVHGAILPPHVLFYPDNDGQKGRDERKHSVRLIDWCYAVDYKSRTRLSAWVPAYKDHYAPELLDKSFIGPPSDIYMAAKMIVYLCGSKWPAELGKVLKRCLQHDPTKRYQKAGDVLEDWSKAAVAEFGKPSWQEFVIIPI